ncbi:MAG: FAD-dependent oxidoreductase [Bacilli bacterium]|nr:FAD-dependent oxidoreductase [Bacilli bacterium]
MKYDVIIIGAGPAGLAAALAAKKKGLEVLLLEREEKAGGILKQCIHDGFGLVRFEEKLTGPEYAYRFLKEIKANPIEVRASAFASKIKKEKDEFIVQIIDQSGVKNERAKNIIIATGCRERSRNQVLIPGTRAAGIYTAGLAQYLVNCLGLSPGKNIVILGSGDIGLIMARRLTLEGANVLGVYEIKSTPSGLTRNIHQCLTDFKIPLYLSKTVSNIYGEGRVQAVGISPVDEKMQIIPDTEELITCDCLILAVGLIPENELAESLGVSIDPKTKGAIVDQNLMSSIPGVFAVGNCLHVNDLVDYVSESAEIAALALKDKYLKRKLVTINCSYELNYLIPQVLDLNSSLETVKIYFRARENYSKCRLILSIDGHDVWEKKYQKLLPPEMERLDLSFDQFQIRSDSEIKFRIEVLK